MSHYMQKIAGALLVLLVFAFPAAAADDGVISAQDAHAQQKADVLTIIDIRRPSEWKDTGIPAGSLAITMHDPAGQSAFLDNITASVGGDKSAPIGLICASGVRSTWASGFLTRNGFTNVVNIREGMLGRGQAQGWIRQGLPTTDAPPR